MRRHRHRPELPISDEALKYAPGTGARVPPEQRPLGALEWVTLLHVGIFLVATTWAFGGGAESWRPYLAWWGSMGIFITLTKVWDHNAWREGWNRPLLWLAPVAVFNLLVVGASLNPSFRQVRLGGELVLENRGGFAGWPSSAQPELALTALWLFDAIWIAAFNVALVVRQRRALRGLLLLAGGNALALAVFGTAQKLIHAAGPYFGLVHTPQPYFFATFIYHNHWGAFTLLMLAATLGLIWHYARRAESRNFWHSPAFTGIVALFLVAATIPLSGSRSSTLLAGLLLGAAFLHWILRLIRQRRRMRESAVLPVTGAIAAVVLAIAATWYIARDTIQLRAALTRDQVQDMIARGGIGSRATLYHDTWRMAQDKLWFGWGMASYPLVFTLYNSQTSVDKLPIYYHDAHSDWLQSIAEHGIVGSAVLALCAVIPLATLRRQHLASAIPAYLLGACALLLVYAWVEFPFANLAVVLGWWVCLFAAVQYGRLQDREAPPPKKSVSIGASAA